MNRNKSSTSINIMGTSKFILYTLASLSVASLFAASAHAEDNCPPADLIKNSYTAANGDFISRVPARDWKLSWPDGRKPGNYAELKLVSAKLTTIPGKSTVLKTATCEYNDDRKNHDGTPQNGNLRFDIETSGKLSYNSYIPTSGTIKSDKEWLPKQGTLVNGFTFNCTVGGSKLCGGFEFGNKPQINSYWNNAWSWCNSYWEGWRGGNCYSTSRTSYKSRVLVLDNTLQSPIVDTVQKCQPGSKYECWLEYIERPRDPFCKTKTCEAEIDAMNNVIGGDKHIGGSDPGMARHLNLCWKESTWRKYNRPNKLDVTKPNTDAAMDTCPHDGIVSWPDYKIPGFE